MNGQRYRSASGGRIDRSRPLSFGFDGRRYQGFAGDTLASALLANGVHLVGRSFKYHRPRGVFTAGSFEPNAVVTVDRGGGRYDPNVPATTVELFEGLAAASQNRWPSLRVDVGAAASLLSRFLAAGFYYKTFMWPPKAWVRLYEPLVRAAAGLGRAPAEPDPDRYERRHAHCDVLVVGAGPAGLAAAEALVGSGLRVIVADEQAEPGGSLLASSPSATVEGIAAGRWVRDTLERLRAEPRFRVLARTTVFAYLNHNQLSLLERVTDHVAAPPPGVPRERLWEVRARQVVLCTGALERPLVFDNNDRPGILLADAARTYVNRYGVLPGDRVALFATSDSAHQAALDVRAAGGNVVAVVDPRPRARIAAVDRLASAGIELVDGHFVVDTHGGLRLRSIEVVPRGERASSAARRRHIDCDALLVSGGWTPSVHLFSQSRGRLDYAEAIAAFVPGEPSQAVWCAGSINGEYRTSRCIEQGREAARAAAASLGRGAPPDAAREAPSRAGGAAAAGAGATGAAARGEAGVPSADSEPTAAETIVRVPSGLPPMQASAFVDLQNDVTHKDILLAVREGFHSIEHVKRYTSNGMASDQGKTSNMAGLGIVAGELGVAIPLVGTTTFRMPYTPVSFGAIAGQDSHELFDPVRKTPTHAWAESHGAVFEDVGQWKRARHFPLAGEDMHAAVARECVAVRERVGLFDASTLGKIEVVGADAAEFLERIYVNSWRTLQPGRCRYGLMLREDGFIMDDGVIGRMAPDRFHVTTTTGGAARVLAHMEDYLQTEWSELRVFLASVTEHWAVVAVQGPRARETIASLIEGIDLAAAAMPHMSVREGRCCGVECRLFRVSFTGELGYEINVPAEHGRTVWEAVHDAARRFGATCYGTEAMHVLRAEKGYIIVGQETDGTTTPDDVGLGRMVGAAKRDFVGMRSLAREELRRADRKQLVALRTGDERLVLEEGAQVIETAAAPGRPRILGHVTSSYWSACCGHSIALALIERGRERTGGVVGVTTTDGGTTSARVVSPVFVDPDGARLAG